MHGSGNRLEYPIGHVVYEPATVFSVRVLPGRPLRHRGGPRRRASGARALRPLAPRPRGQKDRALTRLGRLAGSELVPGDPGGPLRGQPGDDHAPPRREPRRAASAWWRGSREISICTTSTRGGASCSSGGFAAAAWSACLRASRRSATCRGWTPPVAPDLSADGRQLLLSECGRIGPAWTPRTCGRRTARRPCGSAKTRACRCRRTAASSSPSRGSRTIRTTSCSSPPARASGASCDTPPSGTSRWRAAWFPDGRRIAVVGGESGRRGRSSSSGTSR